MFFFKKRRREQIKNRPFPNEWRKIVKQTVPYFQLLSPKEQEELEGKIQIFIEEKQFEGMDGVEITDEMRVTVAAQACMLLLNRETDCYPMLDTILVYPHRYVARLSKRMPDGTVREAFETRLGESWSDGQMVLSWDDVKHGAADVHDGHNLVFHEFAHQLDSESGSTRGDPVLPHRSMYIAWARVLGREYAQLIEDLAHHRPACLDSYAATNPAEFFAVVTEAFFEQPLKLRRCYPELYDQIKLFYAQDPAARYE